MPFGCADPVVVGGRFCSFCFKAVQLKIICPGFQQYKETRISFQVEASWSITGGDTKAMQDCFGGALAGKSTLCISIYSLAITAAVDREVFCFLKCTSIRSSKLFLHPAMKITSRDPEMPEEGASSYGGVRGILKVPFSLDSSLNPLSLRPHSLLHLRGWVP